MSDIENASYKLSNYGNFIKQYPQIKEQKKESDVFKECKKKKVKKTHKSRKKTKTDIIRELSPIDNSNSIINTVNKSSINSKITNLQNLDNSENKLISKKKSSDIIEFPVSEKKFVKKNTNNKLFTKKTITNYPYTLSKNNSNPNYLKSVRRSRCKPNSTDFSSSKDCFSFPNITYDNNNNNTLVRNNSAIKTTEINSIFNKDEESINEINQIKKIVNCFICSKNVILPKICPKCQKVACEKCLDKYFNIEKNTKCYYCKNKMNYDDMISVPFMKNVVSFIEKITIPSFEKIQSNSPERNINTDKIIFHPNYEVQKCYVRKCLSPKKLINSNRCEKHNDQILSYYCIDCDKAYCRTCFVFFGEEKDNHINHLIIDYEKAVNLNISEMKKNLNKIKEKYDELNLYINRCETLKNCYNFEKKNFVDFVKNILKKFEEETIKKINQINETINIFKRQTTELEKCQNEIKKFFIKAKVSQNIEKDKNLIEKINKLKENKYLTSAEIDVYANMSNNFTFNLYKSELEKFEINKEKFFFKTQIKNSKYELAISHSNGEVQIYVFEPRTIGTENEVKNELQQQHILVPIIYLRRKNKNWESHILDEKFKYKKNIYLMKRFPIKEFGVSDSFFKIKCVLYDACVN